jgi:hypothetical protein
MIFEARCDGRRMDRARVRAWFHAHPRVLGGLFVAIGVGLSLLILSTLDQAARGRPTVFVSLIAPIGLSLGAMMGVPLLAFGAPAMTFMSTPDAERGWPALKVCGIVMVAVGGLLAILVELRLRQLGY